MQGYDSHFPLAHLLFPLFCLSIWLAHLGFYCLCLGSAAFPYNAVTMRGTSGKFLILYSVI